MPTTADFVRWRLEGPRHWPLNNDGKGFVFTGYYEPNHELYFNHDTKEIIVKTSDSTIGSYYTHSDVNCFSRLEYSHWSWSKIKHFLEDYLACQQQPTS